MLKKEQLNLKGICYNFLFFLAVVNCCAQGQSIFNRINQSDGLSNGRVTSIVKEPNGFVWIGTKNGLNRYDGYQMKIYNKENSSIGSNDISDLLIDRKGQLWITTLGGGLNLYDPLKDDFAVYKKDPANSNSLPSNQLNTIFEDSKGNLWLGSESGLVLFKSNVSSKSYVHNQHNENSISNNSVTSIFEDKVGDLWVGTFGGGLNRFSVSEERFERIVQESEYFTDFIYALSYLDSDNLLLGTSGSGLLVLNLDRMEFFDYFKEYLQMKTDVSIVRAIHHDSQNGVWVGTDGNGIYHIKGIDSTKPSINHYEYSPQLKSSVSGNAIYEIMEDNDSNIWIGTAWNGLNFLDRENNLDFLYSDISGKNSFPVLSIYKNKEKLYLGLDGNGLSILNLKENGNNTINYANSNLLNNAYVQCVKKSTTEAFWLGTFSNGLIHYNPETKETYGYKYDKNNKTSISYNDVRDLLEEENGNLWVATWGGGLNYFDVQKKSFKSYRENTTSENSINSDNIISLEWDNENIWVATFGGGLDFFNTGTQKFTHYEHNEENPDSPSSNNLLAVYKDSKNYVWIGTSGEGINRLDLKTEKFDRFEKETNIRYQTITAIVEDNNEVIWFSTKQGIFNYNYSTNTFNTFPKLNGDYHINSVFKDEVGMLYFGEANGVLKFDPNIISYESKTPHVVLTSFKLFNEEITQGENSLLDKNIVYEDHITLKHNLDVITFEFGALLFPYSSNCEYAIKMENFDENWRNIGSDRTVTYTNLSPGDYTFKVKSHVIGSEWTDDFTAVGLKILKPFWLQWWAFLIYALLILGLFYVFKKYIIAWERLKSNLKLEKLTHEKDTELYNLKQQFFTNISHEIRTPVTLIMGGVNRLIKNGVYVKSNQTIALDAIKKNSNQLLQLVNELLDYKKLEYKELKLSVAEDNFVKYCEEVYLSFTELALQKNINFVFRSSLPKIMLWFDKNQFEKVLNNLLSNAFKFTKEGGDITIEIENNVDEVLLRVSDNGFGMKKNQLNKIFNRFYQVDNGKTTTENGFGLGLAITKEIVDLHKGKIIVQSKRKLGTQFTIGLQKGYAQFKKEELVLENGNSETVENYIQDHNTSSVSKLKDFSAFKNQTILIVEDNLSIRKYILELFEGKCNIVEAENGEQAYALAVADIPDLIVSDVMMPIMDGISLTRKLKSDVRTSHIPIILLTARASVMNQLEGLETGADDYIIKPFNEDLLLSRVNNLLKTRLLLRQRFETNGLALSDDFNLNRTDKQFLEKIIDIIKRNIDSENLNAKFISQEVGMSHSVLYKKIKAMTGMTFIDFVRDYKLNTAKKLIQEYNLTVAEASYHIGYSDKKYFSKLFKQRFGKSPSEFYTKN